MSDQRVVYVPVARAFAEQWEGQWAGPVDVRFVRADRNLYSLEIRHTPSPARRVWWRRMLQWPG